ncbi:MAG: AsmA-like C-terminal region-containing protein, partial [Acidobacteriota bacterium]
PPHAHLEISTNNAELGDLLKIAESFGARPDATGSGTASLTATIDAELGQGSGSTQINGQGKLAGVRLQPSRLKKPLEIANADLRFTGDSARADNLQAQLGSSQANGWLQIKNFNQPVIGFDLKANQLNVAELQQAMTGSTAGKQGKSAALSSLSLRADGQIFIGTLVLDTLTATDVQSKVIMLNNVITLAPVTMKLYGGSYQGSVRIDQSASATDLALTGKFSGMDVNQFLSASGSKSMMYGTANGAIDVRGQGGDGNQLAQSLVGNGAVAISNGKFTSFDLMKQVEVLGKFLNLPTGGAGTAFRSLKTNLKFDHGKMTTDALQLVMEDLQVNGDGWMQLGDAPTVNYDLLAKLSSNLSKRVTPASESKSPLNFGAGFSSVVGNFFMDQGAIALPIKMSGPLNQPAFGLNSAMLQRRAQNQLKETLLDRFNKAATPTDQKPNDKKSNEKKSGDLLKGMLDKFRPKEKP